MDRLIESISRLNTSCENTITDEKLRGFGMTSVTLRDYQLTGLNWLLSCIKQSHGGLLCDEMGLGKTCQMISFVLAALNQNSGSKFLIVCPLSVVDNWKTEFERFTPNIKFMIYVGDKSTREDLRLKYCDLFNVLLTTYELCINDEAFFASVSWNYLIVDEGHRLKNSDSLVYEMLVERCKCVRFILTGTPVQNNLHELFNLLHFVAPKYFPIKIRSEFVEYFNPTDEDADLTKVDAIMAKILHPFLLRRTKQDVLHDLPPRLDVIIYHNLSALQTKIYRALLTKNADVFLSVLDSSNSGRASSNRLSNLIIQLRKCVNHPYLFDGVEPEPFTLGEHIVETSSKLFLLDLLLTYLYDPYSINLSKQFDLNNSKPVHKVLIFSQMTRMLDIIQDYLTLRNYPYERLDGSVRGEDRFQAVKGFNRDQDTFIFLLSSRAGGQGLNLTAADTVIFVDSDFNPQVDIQAASRAHRIGQTKPVRVIRLVGRNTIEEAILARAEIKLKLTDRVLKSTHADTTNESKFKINELDNVLKFGLAQLFKSIGTDENNLLNDQSDQIKQMSSLDFATILGSTDPKTGHWLEPQKQLINPDDNSNNNTNKSESFPNWIVLTNEPYQCEPSEDDKKAAENLKLIHEASTIQTDEISEGHQTRLRIPRLNDQTSKLLQEPSVLKKLTPEEIEARKMRIAELKIERQKRQQEANEKRVQKRLEKKLALWKSAGYESLAVYRQDSQTDDLNDDGEEDILLNATDENEEIFIDDNEFEANNDSSLTQTPTIHYKIGDASKPLTIFSLNPNNYDNNGLPPYFVCLTVDDSGNWGRGGFFQSLNNCTNSIKLAYELAGEMDDLNMGDCHIIPIQNNSLINNNNNNNSNDNIQIKTFEDYINQSNSTNLDDMNNQWSTNFCGLLVSQKHSRRSQSAGNPPDLKLEFLEQSLRALGMACGRLKRCSVHIPRLGHGTHAFVWYSVERLLRKYLVDQHRISVYVYYYRPSNSTNPNIGTLMNNSQTYSIQTNLKRPSSSTSDDMSTNQNSHRPAKHLRNIFSGKLFYLNYLNEEKKRIIKRLIIAYDGNISDNLDSSVTHIIVDEKSDSLSNYDLNRMTCYTVTLSWIHASIKAGSCESESEYEFK